MWCQRKKKFLEGIKICDKLNETEFEAVLKKIYEVYKESEELSEIKISNERISQEERILILKTIYYIVQRLHIFIMSPLKLQNDLKELEFSPEKSEIIIKFYTEVSRSIINNLDIDVSFPADEEVFWEIKTTLSEPTNQKCKIPKAKINLKTSSQSLQFDDLNHSELSRLFDKLEVIQSELDNLNK